MIRFFGSLKGFWAVRIISRRKNIQKTDNIFVKKVLTKGEKGDILSKSLREREAEREVQKNFLKKSKKST